MQPEHCSSKAAEAGLAHNDDQVQAHRARTSLPQNAMEKIMRPSTFTLRQKYFCVGRGKRRLGRHVLKGMENKVLPRSHDALIAF